MTEQAPTASLGERAWRIASLAWVPLVASLVSLILSIGSIIIATRDPAVTVLLPGEIRFVQGEAIGFAYAYLQPTFVSNGANDRVEVIRDMRLVLTPQDGNPVEFVWDEVGRLDFDPADGSLTYTYLADAVPLLVAPDAAENPLALFQGPDGRYLTAGVYRAELIATRVVASDALRASFELTLTQEQIDFLDEADGGQFLTVPIAEGG